MINQSVLRHIFKESGRGTNLLQFAEIQLLDNEACIVPYNEMTRQELFHSENNSHADRSCHEPSRNAELQVETACPV